MTDKSEEAAKELEEALRTGAPFDPSKLRILARVTIRKFDGDDTSQAPIETIVTEDPGFAEILARKKEDSNAPD